MKSVRALLDWGAAQLQDGEDSRYEATILLTYVLGCERVALMTAPDKIPELIQQQAFEALIHRRQQGEPIAMIIGKKGFWKWGFSVTADTLIPRPETELLIEQVLAHLPEIPSSESSLQIPLTLVDVGTGSGIIACTLAKERPNWHIIATDSPAAALAVAQTNAENLNLRPSANRVSNIEFRLTDWCEGLAPQSVDAIVSNPPYIAQNDPHVTQGDLRFEPLSALVSGPTGLEAYEAIIPMAKVALKPGGLLAFEHGFEQAEDLQALMKAHGFTAIQTFKDLSNHPRVTMGTLD